MAQNHAKAKLNRGFRPDGKLNFVSERRQPQRRPQDDPPPLLSRSTTASSAFSTTSDTTSSSAVQGTSETPAVFRTTVPRPDYPAGQRESLGAVARQTLDALSRFLRPGDLAAAAEVQKYTATNLRRLHPAACPGFVHAATIRVVNSDTFNAAIGLVRPHGGRPPLVVNFANRHNPGGGWLNGAVAQEEALFYRSSLALGLPKELYPIRHGTILYNPHVVVIREAMASGHGLLVPGIAPADLPVVSAVTVAALRGPPVQKLSLRSTWPKKPNGERADHEEERDRMDVDFEEATPSTPSCDTEMAFFDDRDRDTTKTKMRQTLRAAASNKHDQLVLGALGCGVFGNPPEDVAHCWLEVLREHEFAAGHWWRDVVFAVYAGSDQRAKNNYEIFHRVLDGQMV